MEIQKKLEACQTFKRQQIIPLKKFLKNNNKTNKRDEM